MPFFASGLIGPEKPASDRVPSTGVGRLKGAQMRRENARTVSARALTGTVARMAVVGALMTSALGVVLVVGGAPSASADVFYGRQQTLIQAGLNGPAGIGVDAAGDVFVLDTSARVLELAPGATQQTVLPFVGLNEPSGVAVDAAGDAFVADTDDNRIVEVANGAKKQTVLRFKGLNAPDGVAVDAA